jgi:hypothetical protein
VFNDIDVMPLVKNLFDYETTHRVVKHFYGYTHTLGGIVSMKGGDFEMVNGFPNFWAWGYEDNLIQFRIMKSGMTIDRSNFHAIYDKNFIMLHDGLSRVVNKREYDRYLNETKEGVDSITQLNYVIRADGSGFVDVDGFSTNSVPFTSGNSVYDLRNGPRPFGSAIPMKQKRIGSMKMAF